MKGNLNVYTCAAGHKTVTIDSDEGVTPFMLGCRHDGCSAMAESSFYRVPPNLEPTHEWYKPGIAEFRKLSAGAADHVARGGLLLRKIGPESVVILDPVPEKYPPRADVPDLAPLRSRPVRSFKNAGLVNGGAWGSFMPAMRDRPGFKRRKP